jgi:hypothetical protein
MSSSQKTLFANTVTSLDSVGVKMIEYDSLIDNDWSDLKI